MYKASNQGIKPTNILISVIPFYRHIFSQNKHPRGNPITFLPILTARTHETVSDQHIAILLGKNAGRTAPFSLLTLLPFSLMEPSLFTSAALLLLLPGERSHHQTRPNQSNPQIKIPQNPNLLLSLIIHAPSRFWQSVALKIFSITSMARFCNLDTYVYLKFFGHFCVTVIIYEQRSFALVTTVSSFFPLSIT